MTPLLFLLCSYTNIISAVYITCHKELLFKSLCSSEGYILTYFIVNCRSSCFFGCASPHVLLWRKNACLHILPQCEYLKETAWINQCPTTGCTYQQPELVTDNWIKPKPPLVQIYHTWLGFKYCMFCRNMNLVIFMKQWYSFLVFISFPSLLLFFQYMLSLVIFYDEPSPICYHSKLFKVFRPQWHRFNFFLSF